MTMADDADRNRLIDTSARFARHRVHSHVERPPPEVIARFREVAREVVTEHVGRSQIMDPAIKPLVGRDWSIVGPAVTVQLDAFDHLMSIAALGVARAGDVIVISSNGHLASAVWGSGLTMSARMLGVEAVVVDGAVMDTRAILAQGLPVWCRGSHPAHGTREKPGSVNVPVSCGGVIVRPGDLVFGDLDGIVVVRRQDAAAVLVACEQKTEQLRRGGAAMRGGNRTFFDLIGGRATIEKAGVEWID
jgi:4-hydroxy-4-methyl-2-oxoglutarate aldolase